MTQGTKRVLIIVTSCDKLTEDHETGLWLEEFAVPYLAFVEAGHAITIASPKGGKAPIDQRSTGEEARAAYKDALPALEATTALVDVTSEGWDAVFFPGGHGPVIDLPDNPQVLSLTSEIAAKGGVVAAVCHGPAAIVNVRTADGEYLVAGREVTAFTNEEEAAVGLTETVPFLLEDRLRERGATFVSGAMWAAHVKQDGKIITGQNPASSAGVAEALLSALAR